jgi:outer membrane protein OmpA-like peptidoglycan-associated protein
VVKSEFGIVKSKHNSLTFNRIINIIYPKEENKIRLKHQLSIILFMCALAGMLSAQTVQGEDLTAADELEQILETARLSYAQTARFTLEASETAVFENPREAFDFARAQKWLPKKALPDDPVQLQGVCLLIMGSFKLKGGLFYSIFKNPHYSYRELGCKKLLQGKSDPEQTVTGDQFLLILGRVLSFIGQDETTTPAAPEKQLEIETERERVVEEINIQLAAREVEDTKAEASSGGIIISLSNIGFAANSARLEETEQKKLREIAEILKTIPGRILITGHTALAGTEEGQIQTSTERAQAVATYLVSLGARRKGDITAQGYGASRPVASNATPEGQALNRRVEITILEQP